MRRSSAVLVALAAGLWGQSGEAPKPASVEGVVLNALTGEPIVRAHVMCDFTPGTSFQYGAMTNAEGKFSIKNLPAANYALTVEKTGYVAPIENGRRGIATFLAPGTVKSDIKLKLAPTGAILGRVLDRDGNPVEGAAVFAELSASGNRSAMAVTDERGQYRLGGLAAGRYRVRAMPPSLPFPPEIRTDGSEEVHHVPSYYPGAIEAKGATRLEVKSAMDLTGMDIKLVRTPFVRVSGVVTGIPSGIAPQSIRIEMRDNATGMRSMSAVGPGGKFEVWNFEPGKWLVAAAASSGDQMLRSAGVEIEVGQQHVDGLELRMVAPFDVIGQAVFEDEAAKPRPAQPGGPPPRMSLQAVSRVGGARGTMPIMAPADGTFEFNRVDPGRYRVNIGWRASIKSIRLGAVEMENNILDLSYGTGGAPVTVVFGPALAEISGTVRDEKGPVAGAGVVLRNPAISVGSTNGVYTASSGRDGSYRFANVPAGKYLLLAADDGDSNLRSDSYEDYEDVMEAVEVRGTEKIVKELKRHPRR